MGILVLGLCACHVSSIRLARSISSELAGKRLELLRTVVPRASRIAILWDERNPASRVSVDGTEAIAKSAGLTIHSVPVRSPAEIEAAFATMVRDHAGALIIVPSPAIFSHRKRLVDLAMKHRLPTVVGSREYVEAGGLASYGPDYPDQFRVVDRVRGDLAMVRAHLAVLPEVDLGIDDQHGGPSP
jgi:putative ABC transport system substrate-binding protein